MTAIFPAFDIPEPHPGAVAIYSRPNPNGRTDGYFCTKCGSRLVHRHVSKDGEVSKMLSVKSGCLDGMTKEMLRSAVHIWTRSAVMDVPDGAEQVCLVLLCHVDFLAMLVRVWEDHDHDLGTDLG